MSPESRVEIDPPHLMDIFYPTLDIYPDGRYLLVRTDDDSNCFNRVYITTVESRQICLFMEENEWIFADQFDVECRLIGPLKSGQDI